MRETSGEMARNHIMRLTPLQSKNNRLGTNRGSDQPSMSAQQASTEPRHPTGEHDK